MTPAKKSRLFIVVSNRCEGHAGPWGGRNTWKGAVRRRGNTGAGATTSNQARIGSERRPRLTCEESLCEICSSVASGDTGATGADRLLQVRLQPRGVLGVRLEGDVAVGPDEEQPSVTVAIPLRERRRRRQRLDVEHGVESLRQRLDDRRQIAVAGHRQQGEI